MKTAYDTSEHIIRVAVDFSDEPFGRVSSDGPNCGERFRDELLVPALKEYGHVTVDLSGAFYGSSWLEEVFGGLVRLGCFPISYLSEHLTIEHPLQSYVNNSWHYAESAVEN